MFNIFILAVLFCLIFWIFQGYGHQNDADGNQPQDLVCDALTGVYFPKNEAISITRGGETLYFLSIENRDKFLSINR